MLALSSRNSKDPQLYDLIFSVFPSFSEQTNLKVHILGTTRVLLTDTTLNHDVH